MTNKQFKSLVKKYKGWIETDVDEGYVVYFPSVYHREQFEKELNKAR